MPCIYVLNKIDQITIEELDILSQIPHNCPISAQDEWNLDELLEMIWNYLKLVRIYTKPKGQIPDYDDPVVLRISNRSVEAFCNRIHRGIMKQFKQYGLPPLPPLATHSPPALWYGDQA